MALFLSGADTGWTFYAPYSIRTNTTVILVLFGAFIAGFSSILTGLNFIVTIHKLRAPGLTWSRLPLFIWALYATSIIQVLATPVLAITLALLCMERSFISGSSIRRLAEIRCFFSISSGSIRIRLCTS